MNHSTRPPHIVKLSPYLSWLFIVVPIVEIMLMVGIGKRIGGWYTLGLVILTMVMGVNLLRGQARHLLLRFQQASAAGEPPTGPMVEGILMAIGGICLIIPGFFTDTIGLLAWFPPSRQWLAQRLLGRLGGPPPGGGGKSGPTVLEGEYRREPD